MKFTIGTLELAPFDVLGDTLFSKRYCSQVIIPLIGMLESEERFRVTLITTGSVIEYLAESHSLILKRIRTLIEENRVELVCSTYTNSDWPLFPGSDLRRSLRLAHAVCRKNGLPMTRTLATQFNTYWPAMRTFQNEFDVFLVRDAFLKGQHAARPFPQMARVGNVLLVVAANNILHDMAADLVVQKRSDSIGLFIEGRLENAVETWPSSDPRFTDVAIGDDHWHWFHSGGAHHLTTSAGPRIWDSFFFDQMWMRTVQEFWEAKLKEGRTFCLVSEFADAAKTRRQTLPDLGDPNWAGDVTSGHPYWVGAAEQRVRAVLSWTSLSWRSREALRKAESMVERAAGHQASEAIHEQLESMWCRQLWMEVSPVTGRATLPCEVEFIREHAEQIISTSTELCFELGLAATLPTSATHLNDGHHPCESDVIPVETELINCEGTVKWFAWDKGIYRLEARFVAEESACGIGFKLSAPDIEFSSCGHEGEIATVPLASFDDGAGILVSPTGLYILGLGVYLIRHNCNLSVGAQIRTKESYLRFVVDFVPEGRHFEWPFTIVMGNVSTAIALANEINAI